MWFSKGFSLCMCFFRELPHGSSVLCCRFAPGLRCLSDVQAVGLPFGLGWSVERWSSYTEDGLHPSSDGRHPSSASHSFESVPVTFSLNRDRTPMRERRAQTCRTVRDSFRLLPNWWDYTRRTVHNSAGLSTGFWAGFERLLLGSSGHRSVGWMKE